jgi:ATP-dependent helicase/nuclease subunit B
MREEMRQSPLGPPLILLTPEQGTFTAERLLLAGGGAGGGGALGTFRAQVVSFRRLAMLIARELGLFAGEGGGGRGGAGGVPKPMDDVARVVLLEETVRQHRGRLDVFGAVADRPGFIQKLDATLRELRQHGHSGASLRDVAAGVDAATARKLADLAVLLDAWSEVVDGGAGRGDEGARAAVDFERVMHIAALRAGETPLIGADTRVWVDGFSAMSALEVRLLVSLAKHAREVAVTLLADPDAPSFAAMRKGGGGAEEYDGPFARTERLHRRLTDAFRQHGVAVGPATFLRERYRFRDPALRRVEAELFAEGDAGRTPTRAAAEPTGRQGQGKGERPAAARDVATVLPLFALGEKPAADLQDAVHGGVELWECSDPETEVRVVAQAIRDMVIAGEQTGGRADAGGVRYRDIGVIVPDLEGYQDAIRRVFTEHGIPHFIDQRRGVAHHPVVELLRSAVAVATNRWDRDDVLLYLKTRLAGVADEEIALVENYVIEHGIDHVPWEREWRWLAPNAREDDPRGPDVPQSARDRLRRANAVRAKVWEDLGPWAKTWTDSQAGAPAGAQPAGLPGEAGLAAPGAAPAPAEPTGRDGAAYVRDLRALLERLNVPGQIAGWIDRAQRTGGMEGSGGGAEMALLHEQAWREVEQLLALLETILAGKERTPAAFERLLSTALESLTLALIPPTVDQVVVSSVTRSRVPELQVVFLMGAIEGQFPKVVSEDAILSDAQREAFNARAADPIGEGSDRQLLEMPFFDYTALTRAARLLVVSYPLASRQGKAVGKSRYLARLRELLGDRVGERKFDAASRMRVDRIGTAEDLLAGVAMWARRAIVGAGGGGVQPAGGALDDRQMAAVYNWLATADDAGLRAGMALVWECVRGREAPRLAAGLARRFYPPGVPLRMSVSQLEKFAACPLQYFMHYTLGLRPRGEFALDELNLGVLYHSILERVYRKVIAGEMEWPGCQAESLRGALEAEVDAVVEELHAELAERTPGYEKMRARTKRTLGIVLEADRRRACAGDLRPAGVEVTFGYSTRVIREPGAPPPGSGQSRAPDRIVSLPVLLIETPGIGPVADGEPPRRHTVQVNGKIDRLDAAHGDGRSGAEVSVIDYKSASKRTLELYRVYWGLSLQLPVYALVMQELAKTAPIAALYFGLGVTRRTITHGGEAVDPESDVFYQRFAPHGLFDADGVRRLDHGLEEEQESAWYPIKFNKNGDLPKRGEVLSHEDFETVLRYARWKIGALADELMGGVIAPAPYRREKESACGQCDFGSLCPFDQAAGVYRDVPALSAGEAVARMAAAMDGVSDAPPLSQ